MLSLEASTRTCKVDTANAARIESDRFLNPRLAVCPLWNGHDLAGRKVCRNSFYTKRAGCNSAEDRVVVENLLRPQYAEYISLNVEGGLRGDLYGPNMDAQIRTAQLENATHHSGHFGGVFNGAQYQSTCGINAYESAQKNMKCKHHNQPCYEAYEAHPRVENFGHFGQC